MSKLSFITNTMWIVIIHADKKLAFEITGEETLRDIKRVLQMVYNFP